MDFKLALSIVGGLSSPSKMPCHGFSIPATECKTGSKLRKVKGSICSICYALKGRYSFGVVKQALTKRFAGLKHPAWVEAISFLILKQEQSGFFRWHDSGDIQDLAHFKRIIRVCRMTPEVKHWLPTREYGIISSYVKGRGQIPNNLTVRLSAFMADSPPPALLAKRLGVCTSGTSKATFDCPAPKQGNKCGDCRACWDKSIANVNYKTH